MTGAASFPRKTGGDGKGALPERPDACTLTRALLQKVADLPQ